MKHVHISQIKAVCVFYASQEELQIETLDNETFRARGNGSIINVPIRHLYDQVQNGWEVIETLQNETCYDEGA